MFEVIKGINIGQGPGNAFGGGIYSASCEIGFSNGPTQIIVNVVKEDGEYPQISTNASSNTYNIDLNGVRFPKMYLTSYKKTRNNSAKLLTLTFLDSSILLDKIQIGLLNRHGRENVETELVEGNFSVRCMNCQGGDITGISGIAKRYLDKITTNSGCYFEKDDNGAGYIILGSEYFTETNCEIPNVDYNFSDLCNALSVFGISHNLKGFDMNPYYRQQYAGSLREVLNSWGGDYGFEFFWNGTGIEALDLRIPIELDDVETFAETNEYVLSSEVGEDLSNTYSQTVVARYLQPTETKQYDKTYFYRADGRQLLLEEVVSTASYAGRNSQQLYTSVALSRYDNALREVYLGSQIADQNYTGILKAFGCDVLFHLYGTRTSAPIGGMDFFNLKNGLISTNAKIVEMGKDVNSQLTFTPWYDPDNWEIFLVNYREDRKEKIANWDSSAASFMGQYYHFYNAPGISNFGCPLSDDLFVYYTYSSNWTTLPQSEVYGQDSLPFKDVLIDPILETPLAVAGVLETLPIFSMSDNVWGLQSEKYEDDKGNSDYEGLKPIFVSYEDFPVPFLQATLNFIETAKKTLTNGQLEASKSHLTTLINQTFAETQNDKTPVMGYLLVPKYNRLRAQGIKSIPFIGQLNYGRVNQSVYDRISERNSNDLAANTCRTLCESDIVSEICNCGSVYRPTPFFKNLRANFFSIVHPNGAFSEVIFPVNSDCYGFFGNEYSFKTTYPPVKKIFGKPPVDAGNVLSTRIIDYDMTPELKAVYDNNNAINEFIYSPTTKSIITSEEFYQELSNLNNIIIPPQKTIDITVAKSDLSSLNISLSPQDGLTNMSISTGGDGVTTNLSYRSRPPFIPKPDVFLQKIKYRLKQR